MTDRTYTLVTAAGVVVDQVEADIFENAEYEARAAGWSVLDYTDGPGLVVEAGDALEWGQS